MKAAANVDKEVIELLLNHGADPSAVDNVKGDDDDDNDDECD
jgi:hypothetical protein